MGQKYACLLGLALINVARIIGASKKNKRYYHGFQFPGVMDSNFNQELESGDASQHV